jgi:mRNA-degrading endonuclease RelE of RelBE toxin-antitoxin system
VREIEWAGTALEDKAALDKGIDPPEYRLRVGDYRVRFHLEDEALRVLRVRNRREAYR